MHLTNYSVNKNSEDFDDADSEGAAPMNHDMPHTHVSLLGSRSWFQFQAPVVYFNTYLEC